MATPIQGILNRLGLFNDDASYAYATDPRFGVMNARKVPEKWVKTTCGYCSVGCGMLIGVRDGKAISVKGDPDHPVNEGKLCPKGLSEHHTIGAEGRALYPMVRTSWRGFRRATWNEALDMFATRVGEVQAQHGPDAFAILSTGQLVSEEFYALGKLAQLGLCTRNYDGNTTLCMASAVSGYKRSFGSDGPPGCYDDLEQAETVVLIGANIADNHPILAYRLFKNRDRRDSKLFVIDPRATKTAMLADQFLPIRPRTDVHLLNGVARVLIDEGWIDQAYIDGHTQGFEALKQHLERYSLAYTAKVTNLSEGLVYELARSIGQSKSTFFAWTMGVNHSTQGTETVNAICNLALLTGNVGRVGGAPFSITGQCNAMGSREMSFTSSPPGYREFESAEDRKDLATLWGIEEHELPQKRGLAYPDIIQAIIDGKIKGLWIIATNPLVSYPDQARLKKALESLDFLVVQDGYHPTPTSALAHLMLPAAIWGEKEGSYTNSERRISKVSRAVNPPGEAKADYDIFLAVAERLGVKERLFRGLDTPSDAFEEWRRVSKGRLCDYSGVSHRLLADRSVQWPYPEGTAEGVGYSRLYADGKFETTDGKARFFAIKNELPPEEPCSSYPFMLNTGRTVEHWHTRTKTGRVPILERAAPEAWVELNPKDAQKLGVQSHDWVSVQSRRGRIDRVRVRVTSVVGPGHVFIPFHFAEANANNLTIDACDPISREPNYKQAAVRIERVRV